LPRWCTHCLFRFRHWPVAHVNVFLEAFLTTIKLVYIEEFYVHHKWMRINFFGTIT
jgi:hypothetical protein